MLVRIFTLALAFALAGPALSPGGEKLAESGTSAPRVTNLAART